MLDPDRAIRDLEQLQELTDHSERLAWSEPWRRACDWLAARAQEIGLELEVDRAANQWFTLHGGPGKVLVIGGHLDSAPGRGVFESSLSLLAGLEVLRRVAADGRSRVTVKLVNWADGEGARFGRPLFGSSAASGAMRDWYVAGDLRDPDGASLLETLNGFGVDLKLVGLARRQLADVGAYLELGVGPVAESALPTSPLVVVAGTPGVERCRITWRAQAVASPPVPGRVESTAGAARFAMELQEISARADISIELTPAPIAGRSGDIVSATVEQIMELRHGDGASLERVLDRGIDASERIALEAGLTAEWSRLWRIEPAQFDPQLADLAREIVQDVTGGPASSASSTAVYDAAELSRSGLPVAVIAATGLAGINDAIGRDERAHAKLAVAALDAMASKLTEQRGSGR